MSEVHCFLIEPTNRARMYLRRYVFSSDAKCDGRMGYHNAEVYIGEGDASRGDDGYDRLVQTKEQYDGDPRWPTRCEHCDYEFRPEDNWQLFYDIIYVAADGGETVLRKAPPGAMWDAWWMPDLYRGPDGKALFVALPPGGGHDYWTIDGPATNGGCWTRTGEPPRLTVTPSILTPRYHGWLRDGVLVEC